MTVQIGNCDTWLVHLPGEWENDVSEATHALDTWYAVSNTDGIVAYFGNEVDAFDFARLKVSMMSQSSQSV